MDVVFLSKKRRKRNRVLANLLNPIPLICFLLAIFSLWAIFSPPSPLWQFFIGLPVSLLVIYWFISALLEDINGEYERLVIQTDINICPPTYWNGFGKENWQAETHVKTNFSAGYFILEYINFLERIPISRGTERLSYFLDDRNNPSSNDPDKGIKTLLEIKNSIENYIANSKKKLSSGISFEDINAILKDCDDFIIILKDLKNKEVKFSLVFLSQPAWNNQMYFDYRQRGYCI